MRYESETDLPDIVRNQLPLSAQSLFRTAFNIAWDGYQEPDDPDAVNVGREDVAHQAGWAAVRDAYERGEDEEWHPKAG